MEAPDPGFELRESRADGTSVLSLHGDLDIAATEELQARLDALKADGTSVLIDLAPLEFMDSTGLACIAQAVREARRTGWDLRIGRELHAQVQRLLELVDGDALFWPAPH
jgi:anti-sigma B factor antagonist